MQQGRVTGEGMSWLTLLLLGELGEMKQKLFYLSLLTLLMALSVAVMTRTTAVSANNNGGYLHTDGNTIRNENNEVVRITGVNWFGFETGNNVAHGLWVRNWEGMLDQIADLGYNTIRIPYSDEVLEPGKMPESVDAVQNPDLVGLSSIEILDLIIEGAGERGLKVILDNHRSNAGVSAQENGLWYTVDYPESQWIANWEFLTQRYLNDDTVVGMDLRNEPHDSACWGCGDPALDWKEAAERAGNAILAINPDLLIFVEGVECYNPNGSTDPYDEGTECTWWGGNLMGVQDHPITLNVPNRLVYSPHEYPASVYPQDWFSDPSYPNNMPGIWEQYWGYIHTQNITPLMFGEFGTRYTEEVDIIWFDSFVDYMTVNGMHGTYWSWNPNSGDTGGILQDDWASIHQNKQDVLNPWLADILGVPAPTPTPGPGGGPASVKLQYAVGDTAATDSQMKPHFQLVNTGGADADLSNVTVRYWFTGEGAQSVNFFCDYAVMGCGGISGSFAALATPVAGADSYVEISFSGKIVPAYGQTGVIQGRMAKSDWSNFDETDDYSYDPNQSSLADYDFMTVYANGALIWGVEPGGVVPPTATSVPPTATSVPPTATSAPPTATPVGPTATPVPPTATSVPPTATSVPPTATSVPPTATSVSGADCDVSYDVVNQWNNGFQVNVTITNNGGSIIRGYTLAWDFANGEQYSSGWNATYNQSGTTLTASNTAGHWNGTINANGGSVSFGFQGSHSGTVGVPTNFTLNGQTCSS